MAINYPTSLDDLTNPESNDPMNNPSHSQQHSDSNDAIEALQAKVGVDDSDVETSHDYKIKNLAPIEYTNTYFVSKEGSDTNDGDKVNKPFLTIGKALTEASSGDCVEVLDNGDYEENLTVATGISLLAPKATIRGTISANNGSNVFVCNHYPSADSQTLFTNSGGTTHTYYRFVTNDALSFTGITNIKNQTSGAILFVEGEMLKAGFRGIQDFAGGETPGGHIHFKIKDIYQTNNNDNSRLIDCGSSASDIIGFSDHFLRLNTPTSPTAIFVASGAECRLTCNEIRYDGDTAYNVAGDLWLQCLDIQGTETKTGNVYKNTKNTDFESHADRHESGGDDELDIKDLTDSTSLRSTWSGKQDELQKEVIEIEAGDWSSKQATKTVTGLRSDSIVWVSPRPDSYDNYIDAQIRATSQDTNELTFECDETPTESIFINIAFE